MGTREAELRKYETKVLCARKRSFQRHFTDGLEMVGYVFIVCVYLKEASFWRLFVRLLLHLLLTKPYTGSVDSLDDDMYAEYKKKVKMVLNMVIFTNLTVFIFDLFYGLPPDHDTNMGFLHGSLTLQIIGESSPSSSLIYIYFDIVIFAFQILLFYFTCYEPARKRDEKHDPAQALHDIDEGYSISKIEADGYTGQVKLIVFNPLEMLKTVSKYGNFTDELYYNDDYATRA